MAMTALNAPFLYDAWGGYVTTTGSTMNAVGESNFIVGRVYFPAQTGTKTISAAGGGRICFNTAAGIVWASGSTNVRVGIQDVANTGIEDGTFDVYVDLVPGTETIANNTLYNFAMESGTKTLTYGQEIAVGATMTARGGTDVFSLDRVVRPIPLSYPYDTHLGSKSTNVPCFLLIFDDGTYGWILTAPLLWDTADGNTTIAFNSGSSPDEYAGTFSPTIPARLIAIGAQVESIASADSYEVILYSDPLGTPSVIETITPDPDMLAGGGADPVLHMLATVQDLTPGTVYGVAYRPTTANNISWAYADNTSGFDILKNAQVFTDIKMAARTNQTGAFVETQTYHLPRLLLALAGFDGGGSGGGTRGYGFA